MKLWEGNVFSRVCLFTGGSLCDHYPWCIWPYYTGLPPPNPALWTSKMAGPGPLLVTSGGHHWRPVQTCSLEDPPPTSTDNWWPPKHVRLAFLLECFLVWLCEINGLCLDFFLHHKSVLLLTVFSTWANSRHPRTMGLFLFSYCAPQTPPLLTQYLCLQPKFPTLCWILQRNKNSYILLFLIQEIKFQCDFKLYILWWSICEFNKLRRISEASVAQFFKI